MAIRMTNYDRILVLRRMQNWLRIKEVLRRYDMQRWQLDLFFLIIKQRVLHVISVHVDRKLNPIKYFPVYHSTLLQSQQKMQHNCSLREPHNPVIMIRRFFKTLPQPLQLLHIFFSKVFHVDLRGEPWPMNSFNQVNDFLIDYKVLWSLEWGVNVNEFGLSWEEFLYGNGLFLHEVGIGTESVQAQDLGFGHCVNIYDIKFVN